MGSHNVTRFFTLLLLVCCGNSLAADEKGIKVSGFLTSMVTQGRNELDTAYGNGLATKDVDWDTRDNHLGIQFASTLNPKMDVTAQFITRGGADNYNFKADWAYVDYRALESVRFRIGKYKIPQFLASDYLDVGYAYPWVRPPQDVYSTNPLISLNGMDLEFKVNLKNSKLLLDVYTGDGTHTSFIPPRTVDLSGGAYPPEMKGSPIEFSTHKTRGIAVKYASHYFTVRTGYFKTLVDAQPLELKDIPGAFGGIGFTADVANIVAYAEYVRRDTDPAMAPAFPDQNAWYTTVGYRLGKFMPTFTFSKIYPGIDKTPVAIKERSRALGFRYDLAESADIKFELLRVNPANDDDGELNHGLFNDRVKKGTIASASFDVIF